MAGPTPISPNPDEIDETSAAQSSADATKRPAHALSSSSVDLLRSRAKPYEPSASVSRNEEAKIGEDGGSDTGHILDHELPLNSYMINPKYMRSTETDDSQVMAKKTEGSDKEQDRTPELAGAGASKGVRFHNALAMPAGLGIGNRLSDRISRRKRNESTETQVLTPRVTPVASVEPARPVRPVATPSQTSAQPQPHRPAYKQALIPAFFAELFSTIAFVTAGIWESLRSHASTLWLRAQSRTSNISYSATTGSKQRGLRTLSPSVLFPLAVILFLLGLTVVSGFIRTPLNPAETDKSGTTQNERTENSTGNSGTATDSGTPNTNTSDTPSSNTGGTNPASTPATTGNTSNGTGTTGGNGGQTAPSPSTSTPLVGGRGGGDAGGTISPTPIEFTGTGAK